MGVWAASLDTEVAGLTPQPLLGSWRCWGLPPSPLPPCKPSPLPPCRSKLSISEALLLTRWTRLLGWSWGQGRRVQWYSRDNSTVE